MLGTCKHATQVIRADVTDFPALFACSVMTSFHTLLASFHPQLSLNSGLITRQFRTLVSG
jgi:hypothetical protein